MIDLIIDTDVALGVHHEGRPRDIDDGFAIVEAINAAETNLLGVTCVFGNAPHEQVYRVANELVTLKEVDVPVLTGAERPMTKLDAPTRAATFLADTLNRGPATIAAIGPLTNIGLLARHYPEVVSNIEQLVVVAGRSPGRRFFIGDAGPVRDFNFENDVVAMAAILESGIPLVLAGFELTSQVAVAEQDLQIIRNRGSTTARYFYENSLAWCRYWTDTFPADAGFHPWDSATISWLRHPEYFTSEARRCRIAELDGKPVLECAADTGNEELAEKGAGITYCAGFTPGGAQAFVEDVVRHVF
ncbi:MAG: nucleoside hydrolase [Pseudomonadales bacterium]|jgi:inosine-uridine nucleoside N-ribohydrolase|nr:nucleoside hydrolase [Pseudomonadales bacterium]MDP6470734.1 nucleoside hydrolase [Pseudomonadales bacterium]MDP6828314.1 nucleoside hydrolase [Pseudomonadales bacterium]MDP6972136.1 nucleoside hydrolase [Pseudomonadales bacterium]|tara:strand:- start:3136 stop:4041 length:906 start_codon:yes stop_codon:yes gene_type:complete